jgi:hypothetical protein
MPATTISNNPLPDISRNNEEILQNIQELQTMETELMRELENNPNLSSQQQQEMISKIEQLTNIRSGLYKTLSGMNSFYQSALNSSTGTLKEQTSAINIVESELNRTKRRLEYLQMEKNNKIRLVEINEYYGDKYAEHTTLMKIVIFTLIPIIILTIIYNRGILPSSVYYVLFIIVGVVGASYFWKTYASIITRDNMNYEAYNWPFDANSAPKPSTSETENDPWITSGSGITCIGESCCQPDQLYDSTLNQCVTKESFVMPLEKEIKELVKRAPNKYKIDVDLKQNIKAYNS